MSKFRRSCFVPFCDNNSEEMPEKIFLTVPGKLETRKRWYEAVFAGVYGTDGYGEITDCEIPRTGMLYCCEDHFNLESDMANWMFFKMMGGNVHIKKEVVPHKNFKRRETNEEMCEDIPLEKNQQVENDSCEHEIKNEDCQEIRTTHEEKKTCNSKDAISPRSLVNRIDEIIQKQQEELDKYQPHLLKKPATPVQESVEPKPEPKWEKHRPILLKRILEGTSAKEVSILSENKINTSPFKGKYLKRNGPSPAFIKCTCCTHTDSINESDIQTKDSTKSPLKINSPPNEVSPLESQLFARVNSKIPPPLLSTTGRIIPHELYKSGKRKHSQNAPNNATLNSQFENKTENVKCSIKVVPVLSEKSTNLQDQLMGPELYLVKINEDCELGSNEITKRLRLGLNGAIPELIEINRIPEDYYNLELVTDIDVNEVKFEVKEEPNIHEENGPNIHEQDIRNFEFVDVDMKIEMDNFEMDPLRF